jgi:hypothetical protein
MVPTMHWAHVGGGVKRTRVKNLLGHGLPVGVRAYARYEGMQREPWVLSTSWQQPRQGDSPGAGAQPLPVCMPRARPLGQGPCRAEPNWSTPASDRSSDQRGQAASMVGGMGNPQDECGCVPPAAARSRLRISIPVTESYAVSIDAGGGDQPGGVDEIVDRAGNAASCIVAGTIPHGGACRAARHGKEEMGTWCAATGRIAVNRMDASVSEVGASTAHRLRRLSNQACKGIA